MELSVSQKTRAFSLSRPPISREYGAWSMLLVAFIVGVGIAGKANLEVVLFLGTLLFLFMARYSLILFIKNSRQSGGMLIWSGIFLSLTSLFALPLLLVYHRWMLVLLGAAAVLSLALHLYLTRHKWDRTSWGELTTIGGASLAAPGAYYAATGQLEGVAFLSWLLNFLYSCSSVFYVRMKVRQRSWQGKPPPLIKRWQLGRNMVFYQTVLLVLLGSLAVTGYIPSVALLAFFPLVAKSWWGTFGSRGGASIRKIGLTELGHAALFALLLIGAFQVASV